MTGAMTSENMSPGLLRVMERVSQAKGVCKHLGIFMRRISGGAVWSNRPRTDACPAKAGMFSRSKSCQVSNQKPCSLDGRYEGNRLPEAHRQSIPLGM